MSRFAAYVLAWAIGAGISWTVLVLGVNGDPARFLAPEYAMWSAQRSAARDAPPVDVLILGDSRTMGGLDPTRMPGAEVRSLALGGTTSIEAFFLLETWLDRHPAPALLVLGFAPYHLALHDTFWERTVKFAFLSEAQYAALLRDALALGDPVLGPPAELERELADRSRFARYAGGLRNPVDFASEILSSGFLRGTSNRAVRAEVELDRGHFVFGRGERADRLAEEAGFETFESSPLLDRYLERLLRLAASRGVPVRWFTLPVNQPSFAAIRPAYRAGFEAWLARWPAVHPDFAVMQPLWWLPNDHFGDRSHLNPRGVAEASRHAGALICVELAARDRPCAQSPAPGAGT